MTSVRLTFSNGQQVNATWPMGADQAWDRVRSMTDVKRAEIHAASASDRFWPTESEVPYND